MGVDNDAKLIVGSSIDTEIIKQIEQRLFEQTGNECNLREDFPFSKEFPHITLISARPWYDCSESDRGWYIRVNTKEYIELNEIEGISAHFGEFRRFYEKFGIVAPAISIFAVPDVW